MNPQYRYVTVKYKSGAKDHKYISKVDTFGNDILLFPVHNQLSRRELVDHIIEGYEDGFIVSKGVKVFGTIPKMIWGPVYVYKYKVDSKEIGQLFQKELYEDAERIDSGEDDASASAVSVPIT